MELVKAGSLAIRVRQFYQDVNARITLDTHGDIDTSLAQYELLLSEARNVVGQEPPIAKSVRPNVTYPVAMAQQLTVLSGQLLVWLEREIEQAKISARNSQG